MNEDTAVTCSFGARPRGRSGPVVGTFGVPGAIAPHFESLAMAEQKAAVNLMCERGYGFAEIALALGRDAAQVEAIACRRCPLVDQPGEPDAVAGRAISKLLKRPSDPTALDRAVDDALLAIDALRVKAGATTGESFDLTNEELCHAMGFGIETARRRMQELEARKMIARILRPGLPQSILIDCFGLARLAALNRRAAP